VVNQSEIHLCDNCSWRSENYEPDWTYYCLKSVLYIFGKLLMNRGATTWFWDCLELLCVCVCGSYWLLNHFLNEN
jgi:hypothetical protein